MVSFLAPRRAASILVFVCVTLGMSVRPLAGQTSPEGVEFYKALKRFELSGQAATVQGFALKRDRVEMTFSGTFYFQAPISGRVH